MRIHTLPTAALLALSLAFPTLGASAAPAAKTSLRYQFTVGETLRYRVGSEMNLRFTDEEDGRTISQAMQLDMIVRYQVLKIRSSDGAAIIKLTLEAASSTVDGRNVPVPTDVSRRLQSRGNLIVTPDGRMSFTQKASVHFSDNSLFDTLTSGGFLGNAFLPMLPVSVGSIWKNTDRSTTAKLAIRSTLTALGATEGHTMADISQSDTGTTDFNLSQEGVTFKCLASMADKSVYRFDASANVLLNLTTNGGFAGNATISRESRSVPIRIDGTSQTTYTLQPSTP